jgi:hypothetical protein
MLKELKCDKKEPSKEKFPKTIEENTKRGLNGASALDTLIIND